MHTSCKLCMYQGLKVIMTFLFSRQKKKKVRSRPILFRQYLYSFVFASYFSGGSNSKQIRGWQKRACTMYIHSRLAQNSALWYSKVSRYNNRVELCTSYLIRTFSNFFLGWNRNLTTLPTGFLIRYFEYQFIPVWKFKEV